MSINTFIGVDLQAIAPTMPMIVVYKSPSDNQGKYVARVWDLNNPTHVVMVKDTAEEIRMEIPAGMWRVERSPNDDPVILETWM